MTVLAILNYHNHHESEDLGQLRQANPNRKLQLFRPLLPNIPSHCFSSTRDNTSTRSSPRPTSISASLEIRNFFAPAIDLPPSLPIAQWPPRG